MQGRNSLHSSQRRHAAVGIVRRPFWLPASNYYVLAVSVAIAFFFLTWGVLREEGEDAPWVTSGVGASMILGGAVVLRSMLLRRAQRYRFIEPGLAQKYSGVHPQFRNRHSANKVTLEQNSAILADIKQKSSAAKVLSKFSAGHREVFELCGEYLALADSELKTVNPNSPRFSALLKGRRSAAEYHRYHLLQWAEIEARSLTGEANTRTDIADKIEAAKEAVGVIDYALKFYPAEQSLLESRDLLEEMTVSIRVSDQVERAERAAFKGEFREALSLYRDALFDLGRDNIYTKDREHAAMHINAEIDRIRLLESGK
ncbi:MAG: hypothetical protein IPL32_14230 [Chloracidobacterium sp.]|nr:hypothetical protein [Chloracidobacterium sp.]